MHNTLVDNALIDLVVPRAEQREDILEARIDLSVQVYMLRRSDVQTLHTTYQNQESLNPLKANLTSQ